MSIVTVQKAYYITVTLPCSCKLAEIFLPKADKSGVINIGADPIATFCINHADVPGKKHDPIQHHVNGTVRGIMRHIAAETAKEQLQEETVNV